MGFDSALGLLKDAERLGDNNALGDADEVVSCPRGLWGDSSTLEPCVDIRLNDYSYIVVSKQWYIKFWFG